MKSNSRFVVSLLGVVLGVAMFAGTASAHERDERRERRDAPRSGYVVVSRNDDGFEAAIRRGVVNGSLTRGEARRLQREVRQLREAQRRVTRDGRVSRAERRRIEKKEQDLWRDIRRESNDRQRSARRDTDDRDGRFGRGFS